ncbi:hypothetical protein HDV00_012528 [Rhizophlyctis rosea]|nr:hypothetical protein HDV00_012528 [Rhizophlyctis rosea]
MESVEQRRKRLKELNDRAAGLEARLKRLSQNFGVPTSPPREVPQTSAQPRSSATPSAHGIVGITHWPKVSTLRKKFDQPIDTSSPVTPKSPTSPTPSTLFSPSVYTPTASYLAKRAENLKTAKPAAKPAISIATAGVRRRGSSLSSKPSPSPSPLASPRYTRPYYNDDASLDGKGHLRPRDSGVDMRSLISPSERVKYALPIDEASPVLEVLVEDEGDVVETVDAVENVVDASSAVREAQLVDDSPKDSVIASIVAPFVMAKEVSTSQHQAEKHNQQGPLTPQILVPAVLANLSVLEQQEAIVDIPTQLLDSVTASYCLPSVTGKERVVPVAEGEGDLVPPSSLFKSSLCLPVTTGQLATIPVTENLTEILPSPNTFCARITIPTVSAQFIETPAVEKQAEIEHLSASLQASMSVPTVTGKLTVQQAVELGAEVGTSASLSGQLMAPFVSASLKSHEIQELEVDVVPAAKPLTASPVAVQETRPAVPSRRTSLMNPRIPLATVEEIPQVPQRGLSLSKPSNTTKLPVNTNPFSEPSIDLSSVVNTNPFMEGNLEVPSVLPNMEVIIGQTDDDVVWMEDIPDFPPNISPVPSTPESLSITWQKESIPSDATTDLPPALDGLERELYEIYVKKDPREELDRFIPHVLDCIWEEDEEWGLEEVEDEEEEEVVSMKQLAEMGVYEDVMDMGVEDVEDIFSERDDIETEVLHMTEDDANTYLYDVDIQSESEWTSESDVEWGTEDSSANVSTVTDSDPSTESDDDVVFEGTEFDVKMREVLPAGVSKPVRGDMVVVEEDEEAPLKIDGPCHVIRELTSAVEMDAFIDGICWVDPCGLQDGWEDSAETVLKTSDEVAQCISAIVWDVVEEVLEREVKHLKAREVELVELAERGLKHEVVVESAAPEDVNSLEVTVQDAPSTIVDELADNLNTREVAMTLPESTPLPILIGADTPVDDQIFESSAQLEEFIASIVWDITTLAEDLLTHDMQKPIPSPAPEQPVIAGADVPSLNIQDNVLESPSDIEHFISSIVWDITSAAEEEVLSRDIQQTPAPLASEPVAIGGADETASDVTDPVLKTSANVEQFVASIVWDVVGSAEDLMGSPKGDLVASATKQIELEDGDVTKAVVESVFREIPPIAEPQHTPAFFGVDSEAINRDTIISSPKEMDDCVSNIFAAWESSSPKTTPERSSKMIGVDDKALDHDFLVSTPEAVDAFISTISWDKTEPPSNKETLTGVDEAAQSGDTILRTYVEVDKFIATINWDTPVLDCPKDGVHPFAVLPASDRILKSKAEVEDFISTIRWDVEAEDSKARAKMAPADTIEVNESSMTRDIGDIDKELERKDSGIALDELDKKSSVSTTSDTNTPPIRQVDSLLPLTTYTPTPKEEAAHLLTSILTMTFFVTFLIMGLTTLIGKSGRWSGVEVEEFGYVGDDAYLFDRPFGGEVGWGTGRVAVLAGHVLLVAAVVGLGSGKGWSLLNGDGGVGRKWVRQLWVSKAGGERVTE